MKLDFQICNQIKERISLDDLFRCEKIVVFEVGKRILLFDQLSDQVLFCFFVNVDAQTFENLQELIFSHYAFGADGFQHQLHIVTV